MKVALFYPLFHQEGLNLFEKTLRFFLDKGVQVFTENEQAKKFKIPPLTDENEDEIDFLITMGGDGTILQYAHKYHHLNKPLLGINLGHLGFMADVPIADLTPSLEDLLSGRYTIENRITLEGHFELTKNVNAINDFVIHRAKNPSLIELSIYLDDVYVNTFEADGVIIATPNGSTAYSLAAGGPILSPSLDGIVITPICPHTISNRPLVLTSGHTIKVTYLSESDPVEVVADGLKTFPLSFNETFVIRKSNKTFKLINLSRRDYFSTLRTKLGWSGKLR